MQKSNLRRGLLASVTVLALAGCSFHHRDDRSNAASARPMQQGSSQQAYNRPAQGTSAVSVPRSGAAGNSRMSDADPDDTYPGAGAPLGGNPYGNAPTRAGTSGYGNSTSGYRNSGSCQ